MSDTCDSSMNMNGGDGSTFFCQRPAGHEGPHEWWSLRFDTDYLNDVRLTWKPNEAISAS